MIGDGESMLWNLPEDFARFKRVTMGGLLIMGRRTYDSLGGALPGRTSVVMTRDRGWIPANTRGNEVLAVDGVNALGEVLPAFREQRWWSIGGGQIYRALWDYTTHLDITEVKASYDGTVTFPCIGPQWRQTGRQPGPQFDFVTYERVGSGAQDALRALIGHEV